MTLLPKSVRIVAATVPRNTTNNGELERGEQVRWEFTISECGVSFNLSVQEGDIVLYASTETTAPNEAIYQLRIKVSATSNSFEAINIIPSLGDNAVNCSFVANVTVFTTIVGENDTNIFTVSTNGKPYYYNYSYIQYTHKTLKNHYKLH